jgi:hypothetical protein
MDEDTYDLPSLQKPPRVMAELAKKAEEERLKQEEEEDIQIDEGSYQRFMRKRKAPSVIDQQVMIFFKKPEPEKTLEERQDLKK